MKTDKNQPDEKASKIGEFLSDPSIPLEKRRDVLQMTLQEGSPDGALLIGEVLEGLEHRRANAVYKQLIKDLKSGPLRGGAFVSSSTDEETGIHTAEVILEDGQHVYSILPEDMSPDDLERCDRILLDGKAQVILKKVPESIGIGDEGTFERTLENGRVEVSIRDQEKVVFLVPGHLEDKISANEVNPGDTFVINPRQQIALDVLPNNRDRSHYKFLTDEPVPDVVAERDIGGPAAVIERLEKHLTIEMTNPGIRRDYGLPPFIDEPLHRHRRFRQDHNDRRDLEFSLYDYGEDDRRSQGATPSTGLPTSSRKPAVDVVRRNRKTDRPVF